MKKVLFSIIFFTSLIQANYASEYVVVKNGKNLTIYTVEDHGNGNFWNENVIITKNESLTPNNSYFDSLGIAKEDYKMFAENQNGIYFSLLEKSDEAMAKLQKKYAKLLEEKRAADYKIEKLEEKEQVVFVDNDGALKYQLAKVVKERDELRTDYNKKFAENTRLFKYKNILEVVIAALLIIIIFLGLKIAKTNFQKKLESAMM